MKRAKNAPLEMDYNTSADELIMPEYGRNVQKLVQHAQQIPDREMRQQFCEEIINLIQQLYPQSKAIEDYREKLWKHLFHIADYKIDVSTPSGEIPRFEDAKKKPDRVPYPQIDTKYRHYGNNLQKMIRRANDMEKGPIKDGFVQTIGAYMKLAYRTWNREHYVGDEIIKTDLETLSGGTLSLEENTRIDNLSNASRNRGGRDDGKSSSNNNRSSNNNNRSGNNNSKSNSNNKSSSSSSRDRDNNSRDGRDRDNNRDRNNNNRTGGGNSNNNRTGGGSGNNSNRTGGGMSNNSNRNNNKKK